MLNPNIGKGKKGKKIDENEEEGPRNNNREGGLDRPNPRDEGQWDGFNLDGT